MILVKNYPEIVKSIILCRLNKEKKENKEK